MVKVKKPTVFLKKLVGFFNPARGFPPHYNMGGKSVGSYKKDKYQKFIKKLVFLIVQFEEN